MSDHQKYRITERVDAGGMAEVFRGVTESLQGFRKNVAIKRILPHLNKNKKFIQMFLDEARLSLHLQHANIVGVFDIGQSAPAPDKSGPIAADGQSDAGAYFIVMEYVDGSNLKNIAESLRRQNRQLTVAQTLYVMMQVCSGLSYAHDAVDPETGRPLGIVHRDISPPNILLSRQGEVKLVDFGLAKATSQLESTDPGVVKGKFSYLSPEAASGKEVDRRADIFAVGVLLYELLTGKRLFYGETDYQTVELVRQTRVPSIRQQNPQVTEDLELIVRRALAKDVEQRYQTAGELQDALAQQLFSGGMKVTSRDIGQVVQSCVVERAKTLPPVEAPKSLINTLIVEELNKFTSIDNDTAPETSGLGAQPLSPEQLTGTPSNPGAAMPRAGEDLVDTSSWSAELTGSMSGDSGARRPPPPRPSPASTSQRNGQASILLAATASRSGQVRKVTPAIVQAVPAAATSPGRSGPTRIAPGPSPALPPLPPRLPAGPPAPLAPSPPPRSVTTQSTSQPHAQPLPGGPGGRKDRPTPRKGPQRGQQPKPARRDTAPSAAMGIAISDEPLLLEEPTARVRARTAVTQPRSPLPAAPALPSPPATEKPSGQGALLIAVVMLALAVGGAAVLFFLKSHGH